MKIEACLDLVAFRVDIRIEATLKMTPMMTLDAAMIMEIVWGSICTIFNNLIYRSHLNVQTQIDSL